MAAGFHKISNPMHQARTVRSFEYYQPDSLDRVIDLLQEHGSQAAILSGGTALLIDMRYGELAPQHVISLWGVVGLGDILLNDETRIGTLATATDLVKAIGDEAAHAGLIEACLRLGGRQIQNMATVGGNICKASPGADLVPPLLCSDALLLLSGPEGNRATPLDGFLTGPDQTVLKPAEVLTEIRLPSPVPRTGTAFEKVMRREAVDCSIVSVAARVSLEDDYTTCHQARISVAAAAPNPFRAKRAEALLQGKPFTEDLGRVAGRLAVEESNAIDDVRASADYRRLLVKELTARALMTAAKRAKQL